MAKPPLDWFAMASVLVARASDPTLITDRNGVVRLANTAIARALGYRSWDLVDCPIDRLVSPEFSLDLALRGAADHVVCSLTTADARTVRAELSCSVVGRGRNLGLIVTVLSAEAQAPAALLIPIVDFTIACGQDDFGLIQEAHSNATGPAPELVGRRCFDVFQCSTLPCDRCPALGARPGVEPEPVVMTSATGSLLIITAHALDAQRTFVRQRQISEAVAGELQRARVAKLASDAGLSEREREVFEHLLLGRSLEEIADALGVAVRTIKYHQANVLRKLGAESRMDLLRVLI